MIVPYFTLLQVDLILYLAYIDVLDINYVQRSHAV